MYFYKKTAPTPTPLSRYVAIVYSNSSSAHGALLQRLYIFDNYSKTTFRLILIGLRGSSLIIYCPGRLLQGVAELVCSSGWSRVALGRAPSPSLHPDCEASNCLILVIRSMILYCTVKYSTVLDCISCLYFC
jgi:hypothetical protein